MSEADLQRQIMLSVSRIGVRLFRNNVAKGWIGASTGPFTHDTVVTVRAGSVVIADARRLHSGLCVGSSDLVGFSIEHNGKFCAIECKSKRGVLTDEQANFGERVTNAGGIFIVGRSVEQVLEELKRDR